MYGYVVANRPEMKIKDYDRYREYYCGVCHSLNKKYGQLSRFVLSYDSAFLAVLLTALYEPENIRKKTSCIMHPLSKRIFLENIYIDYVADMSLVLAYYKCIDDYCDEKNVIKLGYGNIIKTHVKTIKKKYPEKVSAIREGIKTLSVLELEKSKDIDKLSAVFGNILGEILRVSPGYIKGNPEFDDCVCWDEILYKIGFYLGKYVYILDAFDDVEKDLKNNNFNPFIGDCVTMDEKYVKKLLMMSAAEIAMEYEKLPIVKDRDILRNIIYSGIWTKFEGICERRKQNEGSL